MVLQHGFSPFKGGESEALKRLKQSLDDKVCLTLTCGGFVKMGSRVLYSYACPIPMNRKYLIVFF